MLNRFNVRLWPTLPLRRSTTSEVSSLVFGLPPLGMARQLLEAAAAEKLLAVVFHAETDFPIGMLPTSDPPSFIKPPRYTRLDALSDET